MTRGQRGKGGSSGSARKVVATNLVENKENDQNSNANTRQPGRNRNKQKHKLVGEEEQLGSHQLQQQPSVKHVEDLKVSSEMTPQINNTPKKEQQHHHVKPAPQPTSEQLMIAQIIGDGKADDPNQKQKIQKVMDITGMKEDTVATALFDAGWEENRAIELLLEDGDHLTAWKETGSKKRKNKLKMTNEEGAKEDWEENDGLAGTGGVSSNVDVSVGVGGGREKSRGRGPPRLRRGGSSRPRSNNRDSHATPGSGNPDKEDNQAAPSANRGGLKGKKRGGVVGAGPGGAATESGGRRSFQNRGLMKPDQNNAGAFAGSIDTWNNPATSSGVTENRSSAGAGGSVGGSAGGSGSIGGSGSGKRRSGGKDAFDNAGNWGDDFPAADDWDNEEYTGSLADTKVFTARSGGPSGRGQPGQGDDRSSTMKQNRISGSVAAGTTSSTSSSSFVNGGGSLNKASSASTNQSGSTTGAAVSNYSQPIDLSTLLHKPTTQSQQQQSLLQQFNQQATDSLRAGLGIGQPQANTSKPDLSGYSQYAADRTFAGQAASAFTTIKPSSQASSTNGLPSRQAAQQPQPQKGVVPGLSTAANRTSRITTNSKIPSSAVEMPGDNMAKLDVQFGGLDLIKSASSGAYEFNGPNVVSSSDDKFLTSSSTSDKPGSTSSKPPNAASAPGMYPNSSSQAKDVNKSLSNVLSSASATGTFSTASGPVKSVSYASSSRPANLVQQQQVANEALGNFNVYGNYSQNKLTSSSFHNQGYQAYASNQYNSNFQTTTAASGVYANQNSYSSTPSVGFKSNQYDNKFDSSANPAVAAAAAAAASNQGLSSSNKVSATTAGKVNVPNIPPAVASMLPPQYMTSLPPGPFYSLQQPAAAAMYPPYGGAAAAPATGFEEMAALQRTAAGLHTLQSPGYYDPSSQFATANSLAAAAAAAAGGGRNDMSSLGSGSGSAATTTSSNSSSVSGVGMNNVNSSNANDNKSSGGGFGSVASTDSTSSPIPSTGLQSSATAHQAALNYAPNFAAQQHASLPPGYAYIYGTGIPHFGPSAYAGMPMPTATGGTGTTQFQKNAYSYGSAYDSLGQQGNKDFTSSYSSGSGAAKSNVGGSTAPGATGHQYWGNNPLTSTQLW